MHPKMTEKLTDQIESDRRRIRQRNQASLLAVVNRNADAAGAPRRQATPAAPRDTHFASIFACVSNLVGGRRPGHQAAAPGPPSTEADTQTRCEERAAAGKVASVEQYELAQVNIALAREPLDGPLLAGFVAALDPVNARADRAAGFVWRMQSDEGNATAVRGFGDDQKLIINLSVWGDLEALRQFVYQDAEHLRVMRRRREWFERLDMYTVLWWVTRGHRPTVQEAEQRLELLRTSGPTRSAFTFRVSFDSPTSDTERIDEDSLCRA
jgi:hypothetical protein